ncbi:MAG: DUF362 domain-containing protein [Chloroflexi bacterium]|nr:DUF362 domain-containing protein [Chloroflexota bacterium]MBU1747249.1 DUF362 domain-containing protein [Chloroflexota bacterium]MBU1878407.1 DUF362 domain-containing protein [Chloroflexota bacterium]
MPDREHVTTLHPPVITRREFIFQLAALAGLLAGCSPSEQPAAPTRPATQAPSPTSVSTIAPTVGPTATPTVAPTARPIPPRPAVIQFYPDVPSKVVRASHANVWAGEDLAPNVIRQMLDASITRLTGLNDAREAWAALFKPHERVAIKVNTIDTSLYWSHVPLVLAVAECLQEAGIPAEQIVIYDRTSRELKRAGYTINQDGQGVRCYGTDATPAKYARDWAILNSGIGLSSILLGCDALINIPILKYHDYSGVTFAMKNHFGTFDRPALFHRARTGPGIAELNALSPIRDRTRLIIGDALTICTAGWQSAVPGDSILMSFDPVAHDVLGLQLLVEAIVAKDQNPSAAKSNANPWLAQSAKLGLGTNDPAHMDLVEVSL